MWINQNRQNPRFKEVLNNENFTRAIQALSTEISRNVTFYEAASFYDNYECAKYMGRGYLKVFENA